MDKIGVFYFKSSREASVGFNIRRGNPVGSVRSV